VKVFFLSQKFQIVVYTIHKRFSCSSSNLRNIPVKKKIPTYEAMLRCERPVETDKTGLFIGLQIFRKGMDRRPDRGYGPDRS
jgi:hypothetical protein